MIRYLWTGVLLVGLAVPTVVLGRAVPAALFADHAVLQCDKPIPVWGQAEPGEMVTVIFAGSSHSAQAGPAGRWQVTLAALPVSKLGREMEIRGATGEPVVLKDVLVGEVWVASGQSNMGVSVDESLDAAAEKAAADFPEIRFFKVEAAGSLEPKETVTGHWSVCSPTVAGGFSGVAYFFARELFQKRGVPVGVIQSAWGGTPAEAWTSREALATVPELGAEAERQIAVMRRAPGDQAAFLPAMAAWEAANGLADGTNEGRAKGWAAPDFDDSGWRDVSTGFTLEKACQARTGGIYWVRKAVELPAASAGKGFTLQLAYLAEEYDTVYFNGEQVGSIGKKPPLFYSAPRSYQVPGRLVRAGRNVIAARFVCHTPQAGLYVTGNRMGLPVADPQAVGNHWKFIWERPFPELTAAARAARPELNPAQIQTTATTLFNGMIHPLMPAAIRGVIWYQGENNARTALMAKQYRTLFPLLMADWRRRWGQGDFPFYFVQLANNDEPIRTHAESAWALLREAQAETLAKSPNTGMAVTIDIGSELTIHPRDKQDVGRRLALWARAKTYGEQGLVFASPAYRSQTVEGNRIRVRMDPGGAPLMAGRKDGLNPVRATPEAKLEWFEIAGADGKYVWADAVIDGDSVMVSSPEVRAPMAVRYAWATNPQGCNLYNEAGLPASPFRTDGGKD